MRFLRVFLLLLVSGASSFQPAAHAAGFFDPASWLDAVLGPAILERAAAEGELSRASSEVSEDLREYRLESGRPAELTVGEALSPDEARLVRDSSEEAFKVEIKADASYASEREAFLDGDTVSPVALEEFTIPAGKAQLRGVRYPNPGGKPIILGHGVIESSRIWRDIARRLYSLGYDVWVPNWRGHGRVSHRSLVAVYEAGDYGFRRMVTEDLPALLSHVAAVTGQKSVLVGHSMGGMIERAATGQFVDARIEVGAPRGFDEAPRILKLLARVSEPFLTRTPYNLDLTVDSAVAQPSRLRAGLRSLFRGLIDPALAKALPDGFLNADNVTPVEFTSLRENILSDLNSDIGNDFVHMVNSRQAWLEGMPIPSQAAADIPTLIVVGELDMLAPAEPILKDVRQLKAGTPIWSARMGKAGHMDLVVGKKAADRLVPLIDAFAKNPAALGPAGTHVEIK